MAKYKDPGVPGRITLKRILKTKGMEAYAAALLQPWATMEEDMKELLNVMAEAHGREGEGGVLPLMDEFAIDAAGSLSATLPQWMMDVMEHFVEKYGQAKGCVVHEKAMALLMDAIIPDEDPGEGVSIDVSLDAILKRHR